MPAEIKVAYRGAAMDADQTDGIIRLSFASELPVLRHEEDGDFWEILSHEPSDCNFSFINRKGMVLQDHDELIEIGDVVKNSVAVRDDKKTCGQIQIFDGEWNTRAKTDWAKIPISVGYILLDCVSESRGVDGIPVRKYKWRPFEISLLTGDAADPTVGIGRSGKIDLSKLTNAVIADLVKQRNIKITMDTPPVITPEAQAAAIAEARKLALADDNKRRKGIRVIGESFITDYGSRNPEVKADIEKSINEAMESEISAAEWSASLMQPTGKARSWAVKNIKLIADDDLHDDIAQYSYARALQSAVRKNTENALPSGLEGEVHEELEKRSKGDFTPSGFLVPYGRGKRNKGFKIETGSPMARKLMGRAAGDLQVGVFGQGGGLVQTDLWMPLIGLLRNLMVTERLGMQTISGLEGMVTWPRHVAACTPYFVPETFLLQVSNPLLDQLAASPHRVGVTGAVSKQLLLQNAIDAQNWLRDDQLKTHAMVIDQVSLLGTGANNQPVGIANTPGIGAVNFGGPVAYSTVINFKTQLALGNAAVADMAYVTTPLVEQKWRSTPKTGVANQFPIFIWEDGSWGDETADGRVIGLRATATNQITLDRVLFGNFADAKRLFWGSLDVVVNPYSRSKEAVIEVTTNSWMDVMVDHQQSFVFSVDAGDQ